MWPPCSSSSSCWATWSWTSCTPCSTRGSVTNDPAWSGGNERPKTTGDAGDAAAESAGVEPGASFLADAWSELAHNPLFIVAGTIVVLILAIVILPAPFAGLFGHGNPHACNLINSNEGPRAGHPFGFDVQGCDLYANVIYGARPTVTIGLLVTGTSLLIAIVLGSSAAGYMGGIVDTVLGRRLMSSWFSFYSGRPDYPHGDPRAQRAYRLVGPYHLRLAGHDPADALHRPRRDHKDYVLAARSLGASNLRILRKHILPNALAPVIVYATLTTGGVMVAEATLTFLGVGLQAPAISWGLELASAQTKFSSTPTCSYSRGCSLA